MPGDTTPHTDQCIQDAARFGFCEHTRLPRHQSPTVLISSRTVTPLPGPTPPRTTRQRRTREAVRYAAFAALIAYTIALSLTDSYSTLQVLALTALPGFGWTVIAAFGLPDLVRLVMFTDFSRVLPRGTRLFAPPDPQDKQKGPDDTPSDPSPRSS